jgi:predicted kinase
VSGVAAVLIGGPPATGKTTLAMALAPRLDAALLDLDVATAPLMRVVSKLTGLHDLDDPALAGLTRDARYDTLLGLAAANVAAGRPVVLVAPFTLERSRVSAWAATTKRIPGSATMVWLYLKPVELVRRLTERGLARDESKLRDPASYLTGLDLEPPAIPHLALDASQPTTTLVTAVLDHLSRQGSLSLLCAVRVVERPQGHTMTMVGSPGFRVLPRRTGEAGARVVRPRAFRSARVVFSGGADSAGSTTATPATPRAYRPTVITRSACHRWQKPRRRVLPSMAQWGRLKLCHRWHGSAAPSVAIDGTDGDSNDSATR